MRLFQEAVTFQRHTMSSSAARPPLQEVDLTGVAYFKELLK